MRGVVAKRIRREIYGDQSLKQERKYYWSAFGTIVNIGLRQRYQDAKKDYKRRSL